MLTCGLVKIKWESEREGALLALGAHGRHLANDPSLSYQNN